MEAGKIVRGGFWVVALELSNQLLQFLKTFYAARILSPEDFGIVGLSFLILAFIDVFLTTGMKEALIQRKDNFQAYLNTVWVVELAKGVIILTVSLVIAQVLLLWGSLAQPALTVGVIRFTGCIYFVLCCSNVGVIQFEKNLQFRSYFFYQFCGTLTDVVVSVVLVTYMESVWGLFYGILAGYLVRTIASYFVVDFKPRFHFEKAKARELLGFGKWILKGRIFSFLGLQMDSMIVTGYFNLYWMGIYQMAFRIGSVPLNQVANVMGKIVFPAFSQIQDDKEKLKDYFLNTLNIISILLLPLIILVFSLINEFTHVFLGDKWVDIVPVVRILVVLGYLRILASLLEYLMWAMGDARQSSFFQLYRVVAFVLLCVPLIYYWKITGVAFTALIALGLAFMYFFHRLCSKLGIRWTEVIDNLIYPILFSMFIILLDTLAKPYLPFTGIANLFFQGGFVIFSYLLLGLLVTRYSNIKLLGKCIALAKSFIENRWKHK